MIDPFNAARGGGYFLLLDVQSLSRPNRADVASPSRSSATSRLHMEVGAQPANLASAAPLIASVWEFNSRSVFAYMPVKGIFPVPWQYPHATVIWLFI